MAREKEGYRDNLELLNARYPDHDMLSFDEVEDIQAENEQLTRELDAAKRGSITEKLEHTRLQQEYKQARAIIDRIPPEILNQLRKESRAVQRDTPEDLRH